MLRCSSLVVAARNNSRRSSLRILVVAASTTTRRRLPSLLMDNSTTCCCCRLQSTRITTVQQSSSSSSSSVVSLARRPQQQLPQARMGLQQNHNPMLIPTAAAIRPPSPSFSSMMHHHQQHLHQQQHYYYPSNKEAALTFAMLLQTLRLPSQRLAVLSSSQYHHPVAAAASLNVLEEENDTCTVEDRRWKEAEDSLQKLLEAPAPVQSSLNKPTLVLDEEDDGDHSQSFILQKKDVLFSSTSTNPTVLLQPHSSSTAILMDDFHALGDDDDHASEQQQQQQLGTMEAESSPVSSSSSFQTPVAAGAAASLHNNSSSNNNMSKVQQQQQQQQGSSNNKSLREVEGRILHYVSKRHTARALQLFYDATTIVADHHHHHQQHQHHEHTIATATASAPLQVEEEVEEFLSLDSVKQLFFLVSRRLPFDSYRVLLYYQRAVQAKQAKQQQQGMVDDNDDDNMAVKVVSPTNENFALLLYDVGMYERQCDVLRFLDPMVHSYNDIESLVRRVIADVLHKLDDDDDSGGSGGGSTTDSSTTTTTTTATSTRRNRTRRKRGSTSGQERCIPILVSALGQQRTVKLGRHFCPKLYQHMIDHDFDVSSGYLEHLLGLSKYHRQDDLPFPSILHKAVVEMNRLVEPVTVLNVVENLFPYTDMSNVALALESLIHLVKMENSNVNGDERSSTSITTTTRYKVDISILEAMGAAAAAQGDTRVCLLIWDLLDLLQQQQQQQHPAAPSVMIYENTAIAFCQAGPAFYPNVFCILQEMQTRHGYTPCRALIRGLSTRFRYSHENLDAALDAFLATMTTTVTTTTAAEGTESDDSLSLPHHPVNAIAGFNAILAARAERGDLDHALELLDRIQTRGDNNSNRDDEGYAIAVVANADTYGFLFEALGKHLVIRRRQLRHRRPRQYHRHHQEDYNINNEEEELLLQKCWQCADSFLTLMENQGIAPTTHILREYIELLCQMNDVATATAIVRETIQANNNNSNNNSNHNSNAGKDDDNGQQTPVIGNKTLYRVAVANAHAQNFDVAREMAEMGSVYNHEPMPFLLQKINIMERADAAQDYRDNPYGHYGYRDDFDSSVYS